MTLIPLIFIVLTSLPNQVENNSLQDDKLIVKHFNKQEIEDLSSLLTLFDNHVQKFCGDNESINNCYSIFLKALRNKVEEVGIVSYPIQYNQPNSLIVKTHLDNIKMFTEIWTTLKGYDNNEKYHYQSLTLNPDGKYTEFLKDAQHEDNNLIPFLDPYFSVHDVTGSMIGYFLLEYEDLKPFNDRTRLIIAVHYLTLTYPEKIIR